MLNLTHLNVLLPTTGPSKFCKTSLRSFLFTLALWPSHPPPSLFICLGLYCLAAGKATEKKIVHACSSESKRGERKKEETSWDTSPRKPERRESHKHDESHTPKMVTHPCPGISDEQGQWGRATHEISDCTSESEGDDVLLEFEIRSPALRCWGDPASDSTIGHQESHWEWLITRHRTWTGAIWSVSYVMCRALWMIHLAKFFWVLVSTFFFSHV